jgi:hypothetical protein
LAEPALVLAPPPEATREDDGLLTASKFATLKLNADWVVLSACNTAASDGTPDADGLSGLAKAFFYLRPLSPGLALGGLVEGDRQAGNWHLRRNG